MKKYKNKIIFLLLVIISAAFLFPVFIVLMNSFKNKLYISTQPFSFPLAETFAGLRNYTEGLMKTDFFSAFFTSFQCLSFFTE